MTTRPHPLTRTQLRNLMEACSVQRLVELTHEPPEDLLKSYVQERSVGRLWQERVWGDLTPRVKQAAEDAREGRCTLLRIEVVRRDQADAHEGLVAVPRTAWDLERLIFGTAGDLTASGYIPPTYIWRAGPYWENVWGGMRENPYTEAIEHVTVSVERGPQEQALEEWARATLRRVAMQGTSEKKSHDYDEGYRAALVAVLNRLSEGDEEG